MSYEDELLILVIGAEMEEPFRKEPHKQDNITEFFGYLDIGSDTKAKQARVNHISPGPLNASFGRHRTLGGFIECLG